MAELLIKARNAQHDDPDTDRRGSYKRGDVVVVMPDGHQWGAKEGLPNFVKIKIPGLDHVAIAELASEQDEDDAGQPYYEPGSAILAEGPVLSIYRRRRWRILVDNIPVTIRNKLRDTGEATVTRAQIRNYVKRIRDNLTFNKI
jgi:hypothetical protein